MVVKYTLLESSATGFLRPSTGRSFILSFAVGISFGFTFAYVLLTLTQTQFREYSLIPVREEFEISKDFVYEASSPRPRHLKDKSGKDHGHGHEGQHFADFQNVGEHHADEAHHHGEDILAKELKKKVRVLCWVLTNPDNHAKKARHVKATWGKRCNILLLMSSVVDPKLGTINLNISEGRDHLWGKTKAAFRYVYENYRGQYDWAMKADDDTFVIVENLRYMLAHYNKSQPIYFGCKFKPYVKQGYMSGGAGYVLSEEAVKRFVEIMPHPDCKQDESGAEDVEAGKCLELAGVKAGDSRDSLGRGRFFPFVPEHHLIPGHADPNFWYWQYIYYPAEEGMNCCSDTAISFHYVSPEHLYVMDYLIYHLRPFGISHAYSLEEITNTARPFTAPDIKWDGILVSPKSDSYDSAAARADYDDGNADEKTNEEADVDDEKTIEVKESVASSKVVETTQRNPTVG